MAGDSKDASTFFVIRKRIVKAKAEIKAYDNVKLFIFQVCVFVFCKSMSFRLSYLKDVAKDRNRELYLKTRKIAAEYYLEVLLLQYNTLLFNSRKRTMKSSITNCLQTSLFNCLKAKRLINTTRFLWFDI